MNVESFVLTIVVPSLITWYITHLYYKKSLRNQAGISTKEIEALLNRFSSIEQANSKEMLRLKYINEAVSEYRRIGTPVRYIDSIHISNQEKADIYDAVMLRVKGRLGKSNKYKKSLT